MKPVQAHNNGTAKVAKVAKARCARRTVHKPALAVSRLRPRAEPLAFLATLAVKCCSGERLRLRQGLRCRAVHRG